MITLSSLTMDSPSASQQPQPSCFSPKTNPMSATIIRKSTSLVWTVTTFVLVMLCLSLPGASSLSFQPSPIFALKGINGDLSSSSTTLVAPSGEASNGENDDSSDGTTNNDSNSNIDDDLSAWSMSAGDTALRQVQFLASKVSESTETSVEANQGESMLGGLKNRIFGGNPTTKRRRSNTGVFDNAEYNEYTTTASQQPSNSQNQSQNNSRLSQKRQKVSSSSKRDEQVWAALSNLELDMQLLDNLAGQKPQLTALELFMLSASVTAASSSPWIMGGKLTEVLPPTAAAFSAAIGIGAEYVGRVAVADGKEVAAATICCASEAEGFLANAERAKAITPLCVGVSATATTLSLLVPLLLESTPTSSIMNEFYLACPLVSVLSAAVAALALQDTKVFCDRATSVGNRRFAKSGLVGRTWKSTSEQVTGKSDNVRTKWRSFIFSVLPAPILGAIIPGAALATKSVIVTALAAAQTAYTLADCEFCLARATDAVAIKARSAAVCDTYANQGARSAAILPFTSALSGLCAAATAAIVELPFLETLSASGSFASLTGEMTIVAIFPVFSTLFAAAASVSKARCEVDAEAAVQAASTLALQYSSNEDEDPILRPFRGVIELIRLVCTSTIEPYQRYYRRFRFTLASSWNRLKRTVRFRRRNNGRKNPDSSSGNDGGDDEKGISGAVASAVAA